MPPEKRKNDAPFRISATRRKKKVKPRPNYVVAGIAIVILLLGAGLVAFGIFRRTPMETVDTSELPTRLVIPTMTVPSVASRPTLPAVWTISPPTPTMPLVPSPNATLPSIESDPEIPGRQVIITTDNLELQVLPFVDQPIIEHIPRGAVKTILMESMASQRQLWWYVADGYGWIPKEINGVPTTVDYTPEKLNALVEGMDDEMRKDRGNPRLWLQKGWMYYAQKNYGAAISDIGVAIGVMEERGKKETKEYSELYDYRGKVYLDMNDNINAIRNFNDAIKYGFEEASVYNRRALAYQRSGEYSQAAADFDKAIALNPKYGLLYSNRGTLVDSIQADDPAQLDYYAKAIETDMNFPYSYTNRARYYRHKGDFGDHMINDYTMALSFLPHDKDIRNNRGIAYSNRQQYQLALQDFEQVIQEYPDYADPYTNAGLVYFNMGDNQAAVDNLLKAIKLDDPKGAAYYNLGVVLQRDNQYEAAIYCYNKALELNPDRQDARINRAQIYEMLGGLDESKIMANPSVESLIHPIRGT